LTQAVNATQAFNPLGGQSFAPQPAPQIPGFGGIGGFGGQAGFGGGRGALLSSTALGGGRFAEPGFSAPVATPQPFGTPSFGRQPQDIGQVFSGAPPAVAPPSSGTLGGAALLAGRPEAGFVGAGSDQLAGTLGGDFLRANPFAGISADLARAEDAVRAAATGAVADQFSAAGRSGAPGQQVALGRTVARELAPFAFQAQSDALSRGFQGFENERQRQLSALGLAPNFNPLLDDDARRLLQAGEVLQQQAQLQIDEPFLQLERFINPLLAAAGRFPIGETRTGRSESFNLGGRLSLF